MNTFNELWHKLSKSKKYREEFVVAQVKRGIPFQIRSLLKGRGWKQEELAERSGLTQGVISRAMNPNYGNLTLNTLIRVAAGFDVAFIGHFVPFSELGRWFTNLPEAKNIPDFEEENTIAETAGLSVLVGISSEAFTKKVPKKKPCAENVIPFRPAEGSAGQAASDPSVVNKMQRTSEPRLGEQALKMAAAGMGG